MKSFTSKTFWLGTAERAMKNPKTFSDTVTFLKRCGAKVVEWKYLAASKSNVVANPAAFGIEVK